MAVLTPNYELRNTTQKVQENTFETIVDEISKTWRILKELVPNSQKCYVPSGPS